MNELGFLQNAQMQLTINPFLLDRDLIAECFFLKQKSYFNLTLLLDAGFKICTLTYGLLEALRVPEPERVGAFR